MPVSERAPHCRQRETPHPRWGRSRKREMNDPDQDDRYTNPLSLFPAKEACPCSSTAPSPSHISEHTSDSRKGKPSKWSRPQLPWDRASTPEKNRECRRYGHQRAPVVSGELQSPFPVTAPIQEIRL